MIETSYSCRPFGSMKRYETMRAAGIVVSESPAGLGEAVLEAIG